LTIETVKRQAVISSNGCWGSSLTNEKGSNSAARVPVNLSKNKIFIAIPIAIIVALLFFLQKGGEGPKAELSVTEEPVSAQELVAEAQPLLLAEAEKQNISINGSVVSQVIEANLKAYNMSEEEFSSYLEENGYTLSGYSEALAEQLAISRLISQNVDLSKATVSDAEVNAFLEEHSMEFQELARDEKDMEALKSQIRLKLLRDKQEKLVVEYLATLKEET